MFLIFNVVMHGNKNPWPKLIKNPQKTGKKLNSSHLNKLSKIIVWRYVL